MILRLGANAAVHAAAGAVMGVTLVMAACTAARTAQRFAPNGLCGRMGQGSAPRPEDIGRRAGPVPPAGPGAGTEPEETMRGSARPRPVDTPDMGPGESPLG
jgi:hypothetical protein